MEVMVKKHGFRALFHALLALQAAAPHGRAQSIYTPYAFTNFAGRPGGPGFADGVGSGARFRSPSGAAVDGAGNVYVADKNNFAIRKITPDGVVSTLAGMHGQPGTADGVGSAAQFGSAFGGPTSVAVDSATNVYVTDTYNATVRKITPNGSVTTLAGAPGSTGSIDGPGATARFLGPVGITFGIDGNLYVTDGVAATGGYTVRRVTLAGVVTTLAGNPTQSCAKDGTNGVALFGSPFMGGPAGIVMDTTTNLFVADTYNDTIRMVSPQGTDWVVKTLFGVTGSAGFTDGVNGDDPGDALLDNPYGLAVDASGDLYESDSPAQTIRSISYPSILTIAGDPTVFGSTDGIGSAARFLTPQGVAVDAQYNVYVADFGNQTIREISPTASDWMVTTQAGLAGGPGYADGAGAAAQFYLPRGAALDPAGNLYVADTQNYAIRRVDPLGIVTTIAGTPGNKGSTDGVGFGSAQFNGPIGLSADSSGNLYVGDAGNETIRMVTPAALTTTLAGQVGVTGSSNGTGSGAQFHQPSGTAVDGAGNVYVADSLNRVIRKIAPGGMVSTFAGSTSQQGTNDGVGGAARFMSPVALAVDQTNNVYVADQGGNTIRFITPDGTVSTLAGQGKVSGTNNGVGAAAQFNGPQGVAVDAGGNVYVSDSGNQTIRKIDATGTVTTLAGSPLQSGSKDGANSTALFSTPRGIAVDSATNVYVADSVNSTIRKLVPAGTNWVVTTLAGSPGQHGTMDVVGTEARFQIPYGLAVDAGGNIYAIDHSNDSIRKITPAGLVSTFAGAPGVAGSVDGRGAPAQFAQPVSIAVDSSTNIYVADYGNVTVRKISPIGTNWLVTTLAGSVGVTGTNDGTGSAALFGHFHGIGVDGAQNVYVTDTENLTIRKITPAGVVNTLAGQAGQGGLLDGLGSAARFGGPIDVVSDAAGNLTVVDGYSIRQVSSAGLVTTIAGCPSGGCLDAIGSADGPGATARFGFPAGIARDTAGNLYVADEGNDTIRKLVYSGGEWMVTTLAGLTGQASALDGIGSEARFDNPTGIAVDAA